MHSRNNLGTLSVAAAMVLPLNAMAYEFGYPGASLPAGVDIQNVAAAPPPGFYASSVIYTARNHSYGPGEVKNNGKAESIDVVGAAVGLLWSAPGEVLGARYTAFFVQPGSTVDTGDPQDVHKGGLRNTFVSPLGLSWKLGDSGFYLKSAFGVSVPDGNIKGTNGLANIGSPWWIFQPSVTLSYLQNGWNFTTTVSGEFNSPNWKTGYKTGNILHVNGLATRRFGKWSAGPIVTYVAQVSDDHSSDFYHDAVNANRYDVISAGGIIGYDFGPAKLNFWGLKDIDAQASGGTPRAGVDSASTSKGFRVFLGLSLPL